MMTSIKTAIYLSNPEFKARLLTGEHLTCSDVQDPELQAEISEGGGSIWWCGFCQAVHSPNRPGACDVDWMEPIGSEDEEIWVEPTVAPVQERQARIRRPGAVSQLSTYDGPGAKRFLKRQGSKARRRAFRLSGEDADTRTPTAGWWY